MSATITSAIQKSTERVVYINDVGNERKGFYCEDCGKEMIVVKSEAKRREWHFRHKEETDCTGIKNRALHDYGVQILMEGNAITISKGLVVTYTEPRKEVKVFGKRSDVTVRYKGGDIHFEIFVTHDLDQHKINVYKVNKVKCIRIDLSNPDLLTTTPERIRDEVLNQYKNKTVYFWDEEISIQNQTDTVGFNWEAIFLITSLIILLTCLYTLFLKPKREYWY